MGSLFQKISNPQTFYDDFSGEEFNVDYDFSNIIGLA